MLIPQQRLSQQLLTPQSDDDDEGRLARLQARHQLLDPLRPLPPEVPGVRAAQDAAHELVARQRREGAAGLQRDVGELLRVELEDAHALPQPRKTRVGLVRAERRRALSYLVEVPRQDEGARARDLDGGQMRLDGARRCAFTQWFSAVGG